MLEKIALFFAFYIPFQIALNPMEGVDLASLRVFSIVLFLFWIIKALLSKKLKIPYGPIAFSIYLFFFLASFSLLMAENQLWSLRKIAFLFSILPVLFVFYDLSQKTSFALKIACWVSWGAFVSACIGIAQFLSQFLFEIDSVLLFWRVTIAPIFLGNSLSEAVIAHSSWLVNVSGETVLRAFAFFPDPHMFSFYMGMSAPLALSVFLSKKKWFYAIIFLAIVFADLLSFSRGGYLGLASSTLTALVFFYVKFSEKIKTWQKLTIWMFIIMLAFSAAFTPFGKRLFSSFDKSDNSNTERLSLWKESLSITFQNPLGVGIGNLPLEMLPSAKYRDPIYAHNLYLDISSEMGMLALVGFLSILMFSMWHFYKKAKDDIFYVGPLMAIIAFSVHSLVETPLYSVHILALFLIIMSLCHESFAKKNN